ncbi:MAG: hypothetical protein ABIP65_06045 [Vicinamibacterales bacterium]
MSMGPVLLALFGLTLGVVTQARPEFSGTWIFDPQKTMQPGPDGRVAFAAMLGDGFIALQDASSLTLRIRLHGDIVVAVYDLTGAETENVSPGDIRVKSRASWDADRLVILSTSDGSENGRPVTITTRRVLWIDVSGDLIIDRSGTPASQVTPTRSVYRRVPGGRKVGL